MNGFFAAPSIVLRKVCQRAVSDKVSDPADSDGASPSSKSRRVATTRIQMPARPTNRRPAGIWVSSTP